MGLPLVYSSYCQFYVYKAAILCFEHYIIIIFINFYKQKFHINSLNLNYITS